MIAGDKNSVSFMNCQSGLALDVHFPDREKNGGRVQLYERNDKGVQRFQMESGEDGAFFLKCEDGGLLIDAAADTVEKDGGGVQVYRLFKGNRNQIWRVSEQ